MASLQVVNIAVFLIISEQKLFLILLMLDVYTSALINCRVLTGNCYRRVNWRKDDDQYDVFQVATNKNIYLHSQVLYKQIEIQSSEEPRRKKARRWNGHSARLLVQRVMWRRNDKSAPSTLPVRLMATKSLLWTNRKSCFLSLVFQRLTQYYFVRWRIT